MPESSNEATLRSMTSGLFDEMLYDMIMDVTQRAHKEVRRSRMLCEICHTKCRAVHPISSNSQASTSSSLVAPAAETSRDATPLSVIPSIVLATASGSSTPVSKSGDVYFDCANCKRPIASNRYAPHLASCLGLSSGARRGGARTAAVKTKIGSEGSRSNSPTVTVTEDAAPPPPARKGRPPKNGTPKNSKKKGMGPPTTPELNGNNKRPLSPRPTPPKNKKQKSAVTSPSPSMKGLPSVNSAPGSGIKSTHPKIPSRLRASSTSSFITPSIVASSPGNEGSVYSGEGSPSRDGSPDSTNPFIASSAKSKSQKTRPGISTKSVPGKTAPPGYAPPRAPIPTTIVQPANDFVGMDGDDLVDTASSDDD